MYQNLCLQLYLQKTPQRTVAMSPRKNGLAANKVPRTTYINKLLNNSEYDRAMAAICEEESSKESHVKISPVSL